MKAEQRRQAEAVTVIAARNFGRAGFKVDPRGRHWQPLKDAERLGLVQWVDHQRCGLTDAGARLAAEYRGEGGGDD